MSILMVRNTGAAFVADVHSGTVIGPGTTGAGQLLDEAGGSNWAQIAYVTIAGESGFQSPYVLLYRQDGAAYLASMTGPAQFSHPIRFDQWANNWTSITPWYDSGRLLFYRKSDGHAFSGSLSVNSSTGKVQLSKLTQIGAWEQDWAHLVSYQIQNKTFLLLVRDNGNVFIAPVTYHADISAPDVGTPVPAGTWDSNWATITNFDLSGQDFLLFYKADGTVFTAPIAPSGLAVELGTEFKQKWENDWAHILQVQYRQKIG